ncbi:uncharacterized protein A4U43_C05F2440 [Asparagus officinalis]|uniref:Uncharacterized protein n=1 Tax=Asparagus officinalis TaxID=4686 RepID=A0A5P1EPT9_ASPOF|nr:uncharacterized protein A4U43_C05F2440 [Asparagus officinalis]
MKTSARTPCLGRRAWSWRPWMGREVEAAAERAEGERLNGLGDGRKVGGGDEGRLEKGGGFGVFSVDVTAVSLPL